jgi:hypothetical protein
LKVWSASSKGRNLARCSARASASFDVENPETGEFDQGGDREILKIR